MKPTRTAGPPALPSPLQAAARIGRDLCRSAYWDRDDRLCNWMGRSAAEVTVAGGPITPTSVSLGPDLYGGSSGVALFLAELFAQTGDPELRRTALGAIARSIRVLEGSQGGAGSPLSLFGGGLGVAFAAHRVGALADAPELANAVESILGRAAAAVDAPHMLDVVGGNAGAIPALLALRHAPGGDRNEGLAVALGEELCRTATRNGDVMTWAPELATGPGVGTTPLTGFAHGASGIAWALLELYGAIGRADFFEAATGAFAYEDSLFNPQVGNWPDLRSGSPGVPAPSSPSYAVAWCHGAPGIALARLRAIALDPDRADAHRAAARAAVATTRATIESTLPLGRCDATLCHGLLGLAEVVLIAGRLLDDVNALDFARGVGRNLIERHAEAGDWPSGVGSTGPNPSLMLGTAGVGYEFLRLHDPEGVPPVLLLPTSI
jgi:lantibiotic biosynthesis protein